MAKSGRTEEPTANELQAGIHALAGVFEVLNWIEHEQLHKSDQDLLEVKHSLLIAGQLIVADFRRRF